jgi:hypothetical protein
MLPPIADSSGQIDRAAVGSLIGVSESYSAVISSLIDNVSWVKPAVQLLLIGSVEWPAVPHDQAPWKDWRGSSLPVPSQAKLSAFVRDATYWQKVVLSLTNEGLDRADPTFVVTLGDELDRLKLADATLKHWADYLEIRS